MSEVLAENPPNCSCGAAGEPEHGCPYAEDVNNDSEKKCNCCDFCAEQCAMDI